jgi:integrase
VSHSGSIKRDPARGTWTVVVDVDGPRGRRTQIKRRGFATKRAAQAALNDLLNESRDGLFVAGAKVTAGAYLREWLDGLSTSGRRTSTITRYRGLVERHALPELATLQLTDVNALHLDAVYRKMHTGGLSARSIRFLHTVLHRAFADAERKRLLARNPASGATPPSASAARAPEQSVWTASELARFLASVEGHHHETLFRLTALTGLRRGEVLGLSWDCVDREHRRVTVRQTLIEIAGQLHTAEPKTARSRRIVDIDPATAHALEQHRKRQGEIAQRVGEPWNERNLVFVSPEGDPYKPESISQAFERTVARVGLPRLRFHDLRHTHATLLLASGANAKVVSERLGHSSVAFTLDTYGHVLPGQQASAANAVARLIDGGG